MFVLVVKWLLSDKLLYLCTWCFFHPPLQLSLDLVHHTLQFIQELFQVLHIVMVKQLGLQNIFMY